MEIRQLEYFTELCKCMNFTEASQTIHVSQPALSISIQKLEEELDVTLFKRNRKNIILTEAGKAFLEKANLILLNLDDLYSTMECYKSSKNNILRLAFPPNIGAFLWEIIHIEMKQNHPNIELIINDVGNMQIMSLLKNGDIDLGYGVLDSYDSIEFSTKIIKSGRIKLLLSKNHKLKSLDIVKIMDIKDYNIIMSRPGTTYVEKSIKQLFKQYNFISKIEYVQDQCSLFDIVSKGFGISFVLDDSLELIRENSNLIVKDLDEYLDFNAGFIWNKNNKSANIINTFINIVKNQV